MILGQFGSQTAQFANDSIMRNYRSIKVLNGIFDHRGQNHTYLVESIFLPGYQSIELVDTDAAYQFMTDFLFINGCFPFYILGTLGDSFNQKARAVIIIEQLILHFYKCFSS